MERYTSLYRLPENQYTAGSPVLLEAGALLKDSRTGAVLVQLKMRSVSAKPIRAVMVAVDAFDVSGAPLEGVAEYQYLDLSVPRDEPELVMFQTPWVLMSLIKPRRASGS